MNTSSWSSRFSLYHFFPQPSILYILALV
jgi:hypothetical protein